MGDYLDIILGWFVGAISGLIPGIHLNTLVSIMDNFGLHSVAIFGALSGAQLVSEFIPSILLAAPSEELALSVLPAQRLLQKGQANKAMLAGLVGGVFGVLSFFALIPAVLVVLPIIYTQVYPYLGWLLLILSLYLIYSESRPLKALFIFIVSGLFGLVVLNSPRLDSVKLFSMLTGCFGVATLVMGLLSKQKLPKQKTKVSVENSTLPGGLIGSFSGFLVGTFPAISCSQAVALFSPFLKSEESFISAVSSASISSILFSALTLSILGRARNGVMASITHLELIPTLIFLSSFSLSLLPTILLVIFLSKNILGFMTVYYTRILASVLGFLLLLSIYFGGWWGLLVILTSTALGVLTTSLGVRKTECMAMLILPTILFYL